MTLAKETDMTDWRSIETAPNYPISVDVWMDIPSSPLSMGRAYSFCVPNAHCRDGKWYNMEGFEEQELRAEFITHWKPLQVRRMTKPLDALKALAQFILLCAVFAVAVPVVIAVAFIGATLAYAGSMMGRVR